MRKTASSMRRRVLMLAIAAIGVVALGGTALAGHMTDVKSYTGCLVPKDGVIIKVKEGNSPASACTGGSTQVHLSGGDITKISVTGALTGGGDNGEVTIGLKPEFTLPSGCATGRVAKWSGTAWTCGLDNDTTYTAGTGLDLVGSNNTQIEIEPAYRLPGKSCTTAGQFAHGFDSNGDIQCAAPASSQGIHLWQKSRGLTVLPKGEGVDLIIMPLPAGTYLVTAVATVGDRSGTALGDEEVHVTCRLRNGAFEALPANTSTVDIGEELFDDGPQASAVIHGAITLASPDSVRFTCTARHGDSDPDEAETSVMTAVKVGTLTTP